MLYVLDELDHIINKPGEDAEITKAMHIKYLVSQWLDENKTLLNKCNFHINKDILSIFKERK